MKRYTVKGRRPRKGHVMRLLRKTKKETATQPDIPGVVPENVRIVKEQARKWKDAKEVASEYANAAKLEKTDLERKMIAHNVPEIVVGDKRFFLQNGVKMVKYDAEKERARKDAEYTATKAELAGAAAH